MTYWALIGLAAVTLGACAGGRATGIRALTSWSGAAGSASDIHNNDVDASTDDGIEGDYADTNVGIFRNRITNAFSGISAQPSHGGPLYVFRNVINNMLYSPFKLHNDTSGVLIFHNTSRAVDAGIVLPNVNDGFSGKAPDLGCCELGQPLPHYGPRP